MIKTPNSDGEPQAGPPQSAKGYESQWMIGLGLAEVLGGLTFAAVAGYFLFDALSLPSSNYNPADPGTAAFPNTMGYSLLLCSLTLVVIGIVRMRTGVGNTPVTIDQPLNVVGVVAITVIYALTMPYVTYYGATAVWAPLMLLLGGVRSWKWIVSLTVSTMLFAHFVFEVLLSVFLP
jgi:hypothetical protein